MQNVPPIVLECPECREKYLVIDEPNLPSENAICFSDGFYYDEQTWRTPGIIGCVTCELGFFPKNGKVIATPDWDDFYENWFHIKKAEPPTAGSLALELRARKKIDPVSEKIIRKEFWYSVNHTETGKVLFSRNTKFRDFWMESLTRLEKIMSPDIDVEKIIKAEINRNLGRFDICLELFGTEDKE